MYSEKKKIWNGKSKQPFQIFLFPLFLRKTRSNTFLKNTPTPRGTQLFRAYFLFSHDGMSDQNRWHSCEASKIKASSGFWGRFLKPQKFQFYRWHSVFGVKKRFSGSEIKKSHCFFQFSELNEKAIFKITTLFWKKFKKVLEKYKNYDEKYRKSIKNKFV